MGAAKAGARHATFPRARRRRRNSRDPRRNACPPAPCDWKKQSVEEEGLKQSRATSVLSIGFARLEKSRPRRVMGRARTSGRLVRVALPRHVRLAKALCSEFDGLDNLAVA